MESVKQLKSQGQFIDGQWVASGGEAMTSVNPANGQLLWQGAAASDEHIDAAFTAARSSLAKWSALDFDTRCEIIQAFARQIEVQKDSLARLISLETGKPLWESKTEVSAVIGKVKLSIQAYKERTGSRQTKQENLTTSLRFKPHGVVVVLGAFNFPAHLSNGHIVPALLAGNTVLYKPSELTPAVAEFIMRCWQDSGIPPGVINCLQGTADCGKALLQKNIQGVYFTGSYQTGQAIHRSFSERPEVILALEMGGNNPLVIGEINNQTAAVYHTLLSGFITAGQRCTCARRLIIPDNDFGDDFLAQLIKSARQLDVAEFTKDPQPFMGPVIAFDHALQHLKAQEKLIEQGGNPLLKMDLLKDNTGLLSPGIIDMTAVNEPEDKEIFAPLMQVYRYTDFEQALKLANQTKYGLSAGLLSDNAEQYQQFFHRVNAGLINWNRPTTGAASNLPFGGIGKSGNHRPSAFYAADYCAYPIASQEEEHLNLPEQLLPGVELEND